MPRLLRIAGVCILASVMAILDVTVVSVAQRTFIAEFALHPGRRRVDDDRLHARARRP